MLLLLTSMLATAQSNFSKGFKDGYDKGYCYDKGVGCVKPISVVSPIPAVGENINSFEDGYNKGFAEGLNAQRSTANTSKSSRQRYQTSGAKYVKNKMYVPYQSSSYAIALGLSLRESKDVAMEHLESGNYQEVINICFAGLRVLPRDAEFMILLAQAYSENGERESALQWYKKALRYRKRDKNLKDLIVRLENNEVYTEDPIEDPQPDSSDYFGDFLGSQKVYTNSPLLNRPSSGEGEEMIGMAKDNLVMIIEKYSDKYYKVKSGKTIGYIWTGWFVN